MLDYSCSVATPVQYACGELLKAKLGKERPADEITLNKEWETGIIKVYHDVLQVAQTLFVPGAAFQFITQPQG